MKQFSYETTRSMSARAKPLEKLMDECARFVSVVSLSSTGESSNVTKLRDLLKRGIKCGSRITVTVAGRDEEAAVAAIQNYVVANF